MLIEVIPNDKQSNGTVITFLRVIGCATEELKKCIREEGEFGKIKMLTQVTDKKNGCILVAHTHHNPIDLDQDGSVAYRWVLMNAEDMQQWTAKNFEITIEIVLEVHPALKTAEAEEGYTFVSKLVVNS